MHFLCSVVSTLPSFQQFFVANFSFLQLSDFLRNCWATNKSMNWQQIKNSISEKETSLDNLRIIEEGVFLIHENCNVITCVAYLNLDNFWTVIIYIIWMLWIIIEQKNRAKNAICRTYICSKITLQYSLVFRVFCAKAFVIKNHIYSILNIFLSRLPSKLYANNKIFFGNGNGFPFILKGATICVK